MLKDIYLISNDINQKVYIGQSVNSVRRFQQHCKPSSVNLNHELIGQAIQDYGREHFKLTVLESQIPDYNEKEKYYISLYNSLTPNGYNILSGGNSPPTMKGADHEESILTEEQVEQLTEDLINTKTAMRELANKYGFKSATSISEFNSGKTYTRDLKYPLRKDTKTRKLTSNDVANIINLLKNTTRSYADIAKDFNVQYKAISRINTGESHKMNDICYPIRGKNEN